MSPESSDTGYWQITSTAIAEIESVRLYEETVEHVKERHPEVVGTVGVEGMKQTISAPTHVFQSKTDPKDGFVFVSDNVSFQGNPLHVPVKRVEGTSGRVLTAYVSNRPYSSKPLWERGDGEVPDVLYDEDSDVLYISTRPGKYGVVKESLPGVLWRYEPDDGNIVGVTIVDFSFYWKPRLDALTHDLVDHLDISAGEARSLLQINS